MWTFFKPKEPDLRIYVGHWTQYITWSDLDNKKESYTVNFYVYGSGKRTVEIDYNGEYVRKLKRADDQAHMIRLWKETGKLPQGTVYEGEVKDAIEAAKNK